MDIPWWAELPRSAAGGITGARTYVIGDVMTAIEWEDCSSGELNIWFALPRPSPSIPNLCPDGNLGS